MSRKSRGAGVRRLTLLSLLLAGALSSSEALAQNQAPVAVPPGAPETPYVDPDKAYLFAHMTKRALRRALLCGQHRRAALAAL
jgi:hypothetical protein